MNQTKLNQKTNQIINIYEQTYGDVKFNQQLDHAYKGVYQVLSINNCKIQPILLLHSCAAFNGPVEDILPVAYATELFYNFTFAHNSAMNSDSNNSLNTNSAIISGDLIIILTYKYLSMTNPTYIKRTVQLFNEAAEKSINGHYMGLEEPIDSKEKYLEMVDLKTAMQLGIFMQIGAIQAGANQDEEKLMFEFGRNIGMYLYLNEDNSSTNSYDLNDEKTNFYDNAFRSLEKLNVSDDSREALIQFVNSIH